MLVLLNFEPNSLKLEDKFLRLSMAFELLRSSADSVGVMKLFTYCGPF